MTSPHESGTEQGARDSETTSGRVDSAPEEAVRASSPEPQVVPRAGAARPVPDPGAGWAAREAAPASPPPGGPGDATTVLPGGVRRASPARTPAASRPVPARPTGASPRPVAGRSRRARLTLRRIDPWSVFLFSLVASVFLGLALVVAVAVLYAVLGSLGVTESLNELYAEVTGGDIATDALLTSGRIVGGAAVLAAVNVVFLTLLATLGALLYNLCASFTGGLELTFGERD